MKRLTERQRFERWCADAKPELNEQGYSNPWTQAMWIGWHASARAKRSRRKRVTR